MMIAKFVRQLIALRDDPLAGATPAEMNMLALAVKAVGDRPFNLSFGSRRLNEAFLYLLWRKGLIGPILCGGATRVYRREGAR